MKVKSGVAVAMLAGLFGFSSLAVASSVGQLQYLVNRDAGWAKQQLARQGFAKRAESDSDDAQYWWSDRDQLCVRVAFDGDVESIDRVAHDECHVSGSEQGGWRHNNGWNNRYRDDDSSDDNRDDEPFRYARHHHGFGNDHHRYDNSDRDDNQQDGGSRISEGQMSRYCQGEAASKFGQRPQDIITDSAERDGNSYEVSGKYPQQGFDITFSCSFSRDGEFRGVRRTN